MANLEPKQKVLVRCTSKDRWKCASYIRKIKSPSGETWYATNIDIFKQCIPFEGNEHLVGTTMRVNKVKNKEGQFCSQKT